jgi:ribokinase
MASMSPRPRIDVVVIGSINVDYVVEVPHRPATGETVVGGDVRLGPGGKGANQAVAVRAAGGQVAMVGCIGADPDGALMRRVLTNRGVDVSHVETLDGARTGNAYIFVTPDGENSIVVASGANRRVDPAQAVAAATALSPAVLLLQGELRPDTTAAALARVHDSSAHVVLNLAPMQRLPDPWWTQWETLVVNETEAAQLLGADTLVGAAPDEAAAALRRRAGQAVVITLGADGAVAVGEHGTIRVPAPRVRVVDTTGAGDAFVGALALRLARGDDLRSAVEAGVAAGARAVSQMGAQAAG